MHVSKGVKRSGLLVGCFLGLCVTHIMTSSMSIFIRTFEARKYNGMSSEVSIIDSYPGHEVQFSSAVGNKLVEPLQTVPSLESVNNDRKHIIKSNDTTGFIVDTDNGAIPLEGSTTNPESDTVVNSLVQRPATSPFKRTPIPQSILPSQRPSQSSNQNPDLSHQSSGHDPKLNPDTSPNKNQNLGSGSQRRTQTPVWSGGPGNMDPVPSGPPPVLGTDFFYFLGGILAPVPIGFMALYFSSGFLFGSLLLMGCLLNLLVTVGLRYSSIALLRAVSFCEGMIEGSLVPVVFSLLVIWTTDRGRTRQVAMVMSAKYIGDLCGQIAGAHMIHISNYAVNLMSLAGFLVFSVWLVVTNVPIRTNLSATNVLPGNHEGAAESGESLVDVNPRPKDPSFASIPWALMLKNRPLIALVYCCFVFYLLYYSSPLVTSLLGFASGESAVIWVMPQIFLVLTGLLSGVVVVCLRRDPSLSTTSIRRVLICGGLTFEAGFLIWISLTADRQLGLIFLTIGIGFSGWTFTSLQVNPFDLSPNYASLVAALTSVASYFAGLVAHVIFYGANDTEYNFKIRLHPLFIALSVLVTSAAILYGLLGSGERQYWDKKKTEELVPNVIIKYKTEQPNKKWIVKTPYTSKLYKQIDYLIYENP